MHLRAGWSTERLVSAKTDKLDETKALLAKGRSGFRESGLIRARIEGSSAAWELVERFP